MTKRISLGSIIESPIVAIEFEGYCRYLKKHGPHKNWMVAQIKGRQLRLCPVLETLDLWGEIDPECLVRGITTDGRRLYVCTQNPVYRLIEELNPPRLDPIWED